MQIPKTDKIARADAQFRQMPSAVPLEEAVLGAMILSIDHGRSVLKRLKPEHFYVDAHKQIYRAIADLDAQMRPVDLLTVVEKLTSTGKLEKVGGPAYIAELTNKVAGAANIEAHALIILEKAMKREAIHTGYSLMHKGYDPTEDPFEMIAYVENKLYQLTSATKRKSFTTLAEAVIARSKEHEDVLAKPEGEHLGIPTGLHAFDRAINGLQPGDLHIVAARPGMGKTSFVMNIAEHVVLDQKKRVAFFSLEMTTPQLVDRIVSSKSGVSGNYVKDQRQATKEQRQDIQRTYDMLLSEDMLIDDTPAATEAEIRAAVMEEKLRNGLDVVIIDYIQIMGSNGAGNREQELSLISRNLKRLAKEADVHVIALSQLNRSVETRGGVPRPRLSDLRESGALEQDADIVTFLFRPEYYKIYEDAEGQSLRGVAEVILEKNRHGACTTVFTKFIGSCTRFTNIEDGLDEAIETTELFTSGTNDEDLPF